MDFTLKIYEKLLITLKKNNYSFLSRIDEKNKSIFLRHDVDRLPKNALRIAQLEHSLGIHSVYYFRIVKHVFKSDIIKQIADLGHEIGYHYEDLSLTNGNIEDAYESFNKHLEELRSLFPINKICMHGSPMSKWDSRKIWNKYNYKNLGIISEPYFDINYNDVFYITDTGRQWNNTSISVRDKVNSGFDIKVKSTSHLIDLIEKNNLPNKIMINAHPHRWFNFGLAWINELVLQNIKNIVKYFLVKFRS